MAFNENLDESLRPLAEYFQKGGELKYRMIKLKRLKTKLSPQAFRFLSEKIRQVHDNPPNLESTSDQKSSDFDPKPLGPRPKPLDSLDLADHQEAEKYLYELIIRAMEAPDCIEKSGCTIFANILTEMERFFAKWTRDAKAAGKPVFEDANEVPLPSLFSTSPLRASRLRRRNPSDDIQR